MNAVITPIKSSTQRFVEIEDIDNDIVMFTDGSCAAIITVFAVNFGLLSEKEQEAIIMSYAGLLNSLSFPIQVVVRSQHKDISSYLKKLEEKEAEQLNPKLAKSIHSYREFVESMVKEKDVLDKNFYIVIPFSAIELGPTTSTFLGSAKRGLPFEKSYIFERALTVLVPKRDQIFRLLARIGLHAQQLNNQQIAQLFFTVYNAGLPMPQGIDLGKKEHHTVADTP